MINNLLNLPNLPRITITYDLKLIQIIFTSFVVSYMQSKNPTNELQRIYESFNHHIMIAPDS